MDRVRSGFDAVTILVNAMMNPGSACARQTLELVRELAKTDQVELWTPRDQPSLDPSIRHRRVDPHDAAIHKAAEFTGVIHVLSNDGRAVGVAEIARRIPGVVVLHDITLLLLMKATLHRTDGGTAALVDVARAFHGPAVAAQLELDYIHPGTGIESPAVTQGAHFLEYFLSSATVVVTHSEWAAEWVRRAVCAPVLVARLPAGPYEQPSSAGTRTTTRAPIVVPGVVNRHKLVATAIEAYGRSGLAEGGHPFIVLGPCDGRLEAHLRLTARREGVETHLVFMAPEADVDFLHVLADSLAVIVLRHWNTEAQSAAVLAGLLSGRPVIATDAGSVCDIPDDLLVKIPDAGPSESTRVAVSEALRGIADDEVAARTMGTKACEWVRAHHTTEGYADVMRRALQIGRERRVEIAIALQSTRALEGAGLLTDDAAVTACHDALRSLES